MSALMFHSLPLKNIPKKQTSFFNFLQVSCFVLIFAELNRIVKKLDIAFIKLSGVTEEVAHIYLNQFN